jgi:serine-type D-Ala-D-Ala carboxypeptidase
VVLSGIDPTHTLATYLPELRGTFAGGATIWDLLRHRAGLAGHIPLYAPLLSGAPFDTAAALIVAAQAAVSPSSGAPDHSAPAADVGLKSFVYSDCGYILLGAALARHLDVIDAGEAIEQLVIERLGLREHVGTARALGPYVQYAPTEHMLFRGGVVCGAVHDENCFALTGLGGSGHAGLFGTLHGVLEFAREVERARCGIPSKLPAAWMQQLLAVQPGGVMRAGFDGKTQGKSSAGQRASDGTYGHLGFTGTSYWVCPERAVATVLLTNRVCPSRENNRIQALRPAIHDALFVEAERRFSRSGAAP